MATSMFRPQRNNRVILAAVSLLAGLACALVSVYADSRAGCAVWVALAVLLTFAAGGVLGSERGLRAGRVGNLKR